MKNDLRENSKYLGWFVCFISLYFDGMGLMVIFILLIDFFFVKNIFKNLKFFI